MFQYNISNKTLRCKKLIFGKKSRLVGIYLFKYQFLETKTSVSSIIVLYFHNIKMVYKIKLFSLGQLFKFINTVYDKKDSGF